MSIFSKSTEYKLLQDNEIMYLSCTNRHKLNKLNCFTIQVRRTLKEAPCPLLPPTAPRSQKQVISSSSIITVSLCHRGGRIQKINAWYLNTHMVYL
jgi:hypothetical protein